MTDFFSSVWAAAGWSVVWQSTLALAGGLLAATLSLRRPARADGLLVAGVLAALAAPVATLVIHELGWGLLATDAAISKLSAASTSDADQHLMDQHPKVIGSSASVTPDNKRNATYLPNRREEAESTSLPPFRETMASAAPGVMQMLPSAAPTMADVFWPSWLAFLMPALIAIWLALSAMLLARLAFAVWAARRLLARSSPICNVRIDGALASAAEKLGLGVQVEAHLSAHVRCPVIWCWARNPVVLLPTTFVEQADAAAWPGIFCHELAHWKRKDHLSSLVVELLCCLLPWQPLAWWAARRHAQLSELVCDEWALACGQSAESYADALLHLAPQRGAALALAAVRNRGGLKHRIRRILEIGRAQPALGKKWVVGIAGSMAVLVAIAALAQQKPAAINQPAATDSTERAAADGLAAEAPNAQLQHVSGVVLDVLDKPVAAARVYWVAQTRADWGTLPRDDPRDAKLESLAEGVTDDQGRFQMSASFDPTAFEHPSVVVRHNEYGLGLRSYLIAEQHGRPLKVYLPQAIPIHGQILSPSGVPVVGAEVLPIHLQSLVRRPKKSATDDEEKAGWGWLSISDATGRIGELPAIWPQPVKTGVDGRFTIPGRDNTGTALLRVSAQGFGPHGVTIADAEAVEQWKEREHDDLRSPPLANGFTLVLEPPRTITGTVTDSQTGLPVADVEIVLESSRDAGYIWNRQIARATTDAQGHYRFLAPATGRQHHFEIDPPLGYIPLGGRIYLERDFTQLFGNGRVHQRDIQLTPGRIVRGRVVDADTRAPVRDASIRYSAGRGNPSFDDHDYSFREPVLTDGDGTFQITALSGPGMISVDTRSKQHIRQIIPQTLAGGNADVNPHAFAGIDLEATGAPPPLELAVHRGTDLVIEPIGPDGQPIPVVTIVCREAGVPATHRSMRLRTVQQTPLRLPGCAPGKTYRLLIGTPDCAFGAVADVTCNAANGPVKVVLQPTGALRGRLAYADGAPASDVNTFLHFHDDPETAGDSSPLAAEALRIRAQNLPYYNNVLRTKEESRTTTDANGEFEILGIVPGAYLYLTLNHDFASGGRHHPAGRIEAGKTLDIGQLVIEP